MQNRFVVVRLVGFLIFSSVLGWGPDQQNLSAQAIVGTPVAVDESALTLFARDLQLSTSAPGLLMSMNVKEGDVVEQGVVLASLDRRELELRVELAKHRHVAALKRRDSTVELRLAAAAVSTASNAKVRMDQLTGDAASQTERDQVHFEFQRAVLTEEQAQENQILNAIEVDVLENEIRVAEHLLDIQAIKAPVGGVVVAILKRPGEYVQMGESVIRLVKNDVMRVSALVTLDAAEHIPRDAPVRFLVKPSKHDAVERLYHGRVILVSPENLRENASAVPVLAEIDNPERILKANVTGRLEIFSLPATDAENGVSAGLPSTK